MTTINFTSRDGMVALVSVRQHNMLLVSQVPLAQQSRRWRLEWTSWSRWAEPRSL